MPTPDTCATCHATQVEQYKKGKHALAWAAMKAMPTIHWQPMAMIEGEKGCGGCHTIGLKTPAEIADLRQHGSGYGAAACVISITTANLFFISPPSHEATCRFGLTV